MIFKLELINWRKNWPSLGEAYRIIVRANDEAGARKKAYEEAAKMTLPMAEDLARARTQGVNEETLDAIARCLNRTLEMYKQWLRPEETTCELVSDAGSDEIILVDYIEDL